MELKEVGIIYKITNILNKKIYVGQTVHSIGLRWRQHLNDANRQQFRLICKAIRKYGAASFEIEIIEDNVPVSSLDSRESFHIKALNSKGKLGYNATEGGRGMRGFSASPETRRKLSMALKGRPKTEDHNRKVGDANRGRVMTEAFAQKCGERFKGSRQTHLMRPVSQFSKEGLFLADFDCPRYAMKATGIAEKAINNCLNNRSKTAGGYKWSYRVKCAA